MSPKNPRAPKDETTQPDRPVQRRHGRARRVRPVLPPATNEAANADPERPQFTVELVGDQVGQAMSQIVREAQYWINKGRYNKVRIKRGGKALLPDIPVGALMAIEAATFFWSGLLRGVLVNAAGKVLFEVELINDAREHLDRGRDHLLDGDLDDALKEMHAARDIDDRDPEIHLALGALHKARGERGEAIDCFVRVREIDGSHEMSVEAKRQLEKLGVEV